MTVDAILALTAFAAAATFSPGPNNVMLMASGANFGLRRSLPHMAGIALGIATLVAVVGLGLGQLLDRWEALGLVLSGAAALYLLYLAWKIATAAPLAEGAGPGRPLTLLQAAGFQWVNPKAWAMAMTATTLYLPDRTLATLLIAAGVFVAVAVPSTTLWTTLGHQIRPLLQAPRRLRVFNGTMAALVVLSVGPILLG